MPHSKWERYFLKQGFERVAGVDEAGRGPLAGPVVAAAVILPRKFRLPGLDDSKKLSKKKRNELFFAIREEAVSVGIGIVDEKTIDRINISRASLLAMKLAIDSLAPSPGVLLVDGNKRIGTGVPQMCIVRGDSLCSSIAAASVMAKVARDQIMEEYEKRYPGYGFGVHKGYGTKRHLDEIRTRGRCEIHRKSFAASSETPIPLDFESPPLIHFRSRR